MRGLNHLLANKSQLMVLRTLYENQEPLSGRAIERACGLSNRATMYALNALVEVNAVNREITSASHFYTINKKHYLVLKALKPAFDAEDLFWDDVRKTIKRIVKPKPLAAVATGPLVREETDYGGRLTVIMLFPTGGSRIRSLKSIQKLGQTFRERYSLILEHHLLDPKTMDQAENQPLWNRVEREGILLFGSLP